MAAQQTTDFYAPGALLNIALESEGWIGILAEARGRSSVVERQLPKLNVVGSIPIARSST